MYHVAVNEVKELKRLRVIRVCPVKVEEESIDCGQLGNFSLREAS
jgi:hypothetical protein